MKKKLLYLLLALLILFGIYLIVNSVYHSGDSDYTTDPTIKM
jgi:hypothetical protein